ESSAVRSLCDRCRDHGTSAEARKRDALSGAVPNLCSAGERGIGLRQVCGQGSVAGKPCADVPLSATFVCGMANHRSSSLSNCYEWNRHRCASPTVLVRRMVLVCRNTGADDRAGASWQSGYGGSIWVSTVHWIVCDGNLGSCGGG